MADPLHIHHSVEQPSFEELREQYREANRQRVHSLLREDSITFRDASGNLLRDKDGNVIRKKTGYLTDAPAGRDHRRFDEARAQGQQVPLFEDVFIIPPSAGLDRELRDLDRDATLLAESERVSHPAVELLEGPALNSLDEESVVKYMESQIHREEIDGPEAKCSLPQASSSTSPGGSDETS